MSQKMNFNQKEWTIKTLKAYLLQNGFDKLSNKSKKELVELAENVDKGKSLVEEEQEKCEKCNILIDNCICKRCNKCYEILDICLCTCKICKTQKCICEKDLPTQIELYSLKIKIKLFLNNNIIPHKGLYNDTLILLKLLCKKYLIEDELTDNITYIMNIIKTKSHNIQKDILTDFLDYLK
jgi:hypothetical protein